MNNKDRRRAICGGLFFACPYDIIATQKTATISRCGLFISVRLIEQILR